MAGKKQEEAKGGAPEWMATYSDLVTLLLCFFVLLFSMSSVDAVKFKAFINSFSEGLNMLPNAETIGNGKALGSGINQLPDFDIMYEKPLDTSTINLKRENQKRAEKLKKYLKDNGLKEKVKVDSDHNSIKLTFMDIGEEIGKGLFFDTGKAILRDNAKDTLDIVCEGLIDYLDQHIKVEGHTDNIPIKTEQYPNNWYLSAARAITVAQYLIEKKGFVPENISAEGFGEHSPIASNETPEERAKNRRVEIKIMFNEID